MIRLRSINLIVLILFSLVAAAAKLMQIPDEMKFIVYLGWPSWTLLVLGGMQLFGGISLIFPASRKRGALTMLVCFCIVTMIVFLNNRTDLVIASFVPIAMAVFEYRNNG